LISLIAGMRIFVTGASGFIGEHVAVGLRRAGHTVFGLVRSPERGTNLLLNEVNVVVGDLLHPKTYRSAAEGCSVIIHIAADYSNFNKIDETTIRTFSEIGKEFPKSKTFIYTSGILVYPDRPNGIHLEDDPTDKDMPAPLTDRPRHEQIVLQDDHLITAIARPGFVYGKNSGHFYSYFKQARDGAVVLKTRPEVGWSEVHIDDLVDGYIKLVEAPSNVIDKQRYNFVDDSRNTNGAIAAAFAREAGFKGQITFDPDFAKNSPLLNKTVFVDYRKASRHLNWHPSHLNVLDEVPIYYQRWLASQTLPQQTERF